MLRRWVPTVFGETDSSLAISGRDMLVGRYLSTLSSPGLSSSAGGGEDCSLTAAGSSGAGPLIIERREHRSGLAGHPEAGLGGHHESGHLAGQRVRSFEPGSQVFGCAELLKRLVVAAMGGVQYSRRLVQEERDVRPGICPQRLCGAP